jgi:leucine efflux protein
MTGIDNLASFLLASVLLVVIPGPATLLVAATARRSRRQAAYAAAGIIAGDLVLITLSGLGFAALVAQWPIVLSVIKATGAVYLAYLGIELLRARPGDAAPPPSHAVEASAPAARLGTLLRGLLVTLTNPKPLVFFSAFLPTFLAADTPSRIAGFYLLGACFEALNSLYFAAVIVAVARLRAATTVARIAAGRVQQVCGAGLVLCAVSVAVGALW